MSVIEFARGLQEKFELYLLGLVFTILGLAIQTAKFGSGAWPDLLEFGGWIALLLSGLVGLWRLEWVPQTYEVLNAETQIAKELSDLHQARAGGQRDIQGVDGAVLPMTNVIDSHGASLSQVRARTKQLERYMVAKYSWHKWLMVLGFVLLIAARGQGPLGLIGDGLATAYGLMEAALQQ